MAGDAVDETEHMREDGPLHPDLAAAKEHLAATNEVLTALGRSASDLDAMLNTVVRSARRLCRADVAQIHLVDGEMYASPTRPDCRTSSSHTCRTTRWSSTGRPSSGAVGAHDILCGPAWARPILAGIGQAELITFERSGHVPQYEQPDEFRTAVLAWYARCVESA
jgi:pimeloyl-ACP methyl ester carboxylesterase